LDLLVDVGFTANRMGCGADKTANFRLNYHIWLSLRQSPFYNLPKFITKLHVSQQ
jgi:hypothetical protein